MASFTKLLYHCVFSTKDRRPTIGSTLRARLHDYMSGIVRNHDGRLIGIGGTEDHVHMLVELNGATAVADAMRVVKTNSSKWVHETFPERQAFAWQVGYAAFSVSPSGVQAVIDYIDTQESHHRTRTFKEELRAFLDRHGVSYDERYIWD